MMNRHSVLLSLLAFVVASVFAAAPVVAGTAETSETYHGNLYVPTEIAEVDGFDFHFGFHTRGGLQTLSDENNDGEIGDLNTGMKQSEGDLTFQVDYQDHLELYFSASQASRTYTDKFWGHEGYFYINDFPEESPFSALNPAMDVIDLKVGQFVLNFGNQLQRRTINADAQRNPLVGNHLIDPHATETGMEIIHQGNGYGAMVGFGSGVSTESFDGEASNSYRAKLWGDLVPNTLEGALSYYTLSHGKLTTRHYDGGPLLPDGNNLFSSHRMGAPYGGVWDGGNSPGDLAIGSGNEPSAYVLDLTYTPTNRTTVHGLYGNIQDVVKTTVDRNSGATWSDIDVKDEEWNWYGATAVYDLTDNIWFAGRYSVADAQEIAGDSSNDGDISRMQAGVGVNVMPNMMFKTEYVTQEASGFKATPSGYSSPAGTDLSKDPEFDGLSLEATYSF